MNELLGFLRWQWNQVRSTHWTFWVYLVGLAMIMFGFGMDTETAATYFGIRSDILLMTVGIVACMSYFTQMAISMQLARYRYERDRVMQELERKK